MDPSWPYPSSSAFYIPFGQNFNPQAAMEQPEVHQPAVIQLSSQLSVNQPTFSLAYSFSPHSSASSETPSPTAFGEESQLKTQGLGKKYDKWSNEQQHYLVQLWAERQDKINSKDSRVV